MDRAALDIAISLGIPYEGWCPKGGYAEDELDPPGVLSSYPGLKETPSPDPAQRTRWNVRDSDATLIISNGAHSPGTELTLRVAQELGRPAAVITDIVMARPFVSRLPEDARLNVAGPRASEWPEGYDTASELLRELLSP